jgi:hypothetical protein
VGGHYTPSTVRRVWRGGERHRHHQTFQFSFEPLREPIERFQAALSNTPEPIALREIGETFILP